MDDGHSVFRTFIDQLYCRTANVLTHNCKMSVLLHFNLLKIHIRSWYESCFMFMSSLVVLIQEIAPYVNVCIFLISIIVITYVTFCPSVFCSSIPFLTQYWNNCFTSVSWSGNGWTDITFRYKQKAASGVSALHLAGCELHPRFASLLRTHLTSKRMRRSAADDQCALREQLVVG